MSNFIALDKELRLVQVCHSASARQGCAEKSQQKLWYTAGVLEPARVHSHRSGGQQAQQVLVSMAVVLALAHSCLPAAVMSWADIL